MRALLIAVTMVIGTGSCGRNESEPKGPPAPGEALVGTRWTVDEVNGRRTIERAQPTIGFTENRASGRTGCNQFGGSAVITGTSLEVGPLEMTMMACSEEIMEQEHRFVGALGVARAYVVDDGALTVLDGDGKAVIRASRLPGGAD